MLLTAVALAACGKQEPPAATSSKASDPFEMTYEEKMRGKRFEPMSNDDIIAEVEKCEAAGLDATTFEMPERYGPGTTVSIQCVPRDHCK